MNVRTTFASAFAACASAVLLGCGDVPVDANAPAPTGILEGSVDYLGPRPLCEYDTVTHEPRRVSGRAVLLMFVEGNPPPPEGTATTPANLLTIQGSSFFSNLATDCLPEAPTAEDLAQVIKRSAPIRWPEIQLGTGGAGVSYTVQGFYDRDEDFHPFFSIHRGPTAGDLAGAAVDDPLSMSPTLSRFTFGAASEHPAGQIVVGLSVTLAAPVNTESPVFRFRSDPLASEQALLGTLAFDEAESGFRQLTNASLELYDDLTTPEGVELLEAMAAGGLSFDLDGPGYAFYVRELDFDQDGTPEPHPLLGLLGYRWLSPVVLMQRMRSALEVQAGIPDVAMLPALPAFTTPEGAPVADGDVSATSMPLVIAPAAAIVTNPAVSVCQVAVIPPASTAQLYLDQLADCQELPTGRYAVNVIHGVAGGAFVADAASPTGFVLAGGVPSSQTWTIPNELGDPAQLPPLDAPPGATPETDCAGPARCADSQGLATAFLVHDPDPSTNLARRSGDAACSSGPSLLDASVTLPYEFEDFDVSAVRDLVDADPELDSVEQVRELCCAPIEHLCDVPLCAPAEAPADPARTVRGTPSSVTRVTWRDGSVRYVPDCVPFLMPTACCAD